MGEPTGRKVFMRVMFLVFFLIILTGIALFIAYGAYGDKQTLEATMVNGTTCKVSYYFNELTI
ncbi:hypothetical protein [Pontibacillus marinus]|uniref:Uncharacterized protein n=1 Tax=Pontibacillus marinus BH030004 = DSM 16465 TaxID=1385511 RepID=A0A0A5GD50_9BACI|nr:hypothetical protein [Pontibacillus marinus]KGX89939.1 hypothetical protein N783_03270 [Pontibacillus marinus BH030004 = DSM 16465]